MFEKRCKQLVLRQVNNCENSLFSLLFSQRFLSIVFIHYILGVINDGSARTAEGYELSFGVNHLGHFLLTNLLLEKLKSSAPSRVINVSSDAYQLGRLDFDDGIHGNIGRVKSYARSKLANLLFTHELSKIVEGKDVSAFALHPGKYSHRAGVLSTK